MMKTRNCGCSRSGPPSTDAIFDVLASQRRRTILSALPSFTAPMALADLAREVAARETGTASTNVSEDVTKRVRVSLYHVHLPKLADVNLIEYDRETRAVTRTERADLVEQNLELLSEV